MDDTHTLFYEAPATLWQDAMPIGNGRLGAMVRGTTNRERLYINEDSVWYGGPQYRVNPTAREGLAEVRKLVDQGKIEAAQDVMLNKMISRPYALRHYEPLGDVYFNFGHGTDPVEKDFSAPAGTPLAPITDVSVTNYRRQLDLHTGISSVCYDHGGTHYTRSVFASMGADDEVIVSRFTASQPFRFTVSLNRNDDRMFATHMDGRFDSQSTIQDGHVIAGSMGSRGAVEFAMGVRVVAEEDTTATIDPSGGNIIVDVTSAKGGGIIVLVSGETTYRNKDATEAVEKRLEAAVGKTWATLRKAHVDNYQQLYNKVELSLPSTTSTPSSTPTDQRIRTVRSGGTDKALAALLFHYGRYLLISSSRTGLPANLQGIWNREFFPPWGSQYTININIQMNYWPAEVTNLPEIHHVLFGFLEGVAQDGAITARNMYGCRGWVIHHNTDLWKNTQPQSCVITATFWLLAGPWLMTHLWEHYLYSLDEAFLARAYPLLAGCALFFVDYLVDRGDGTLVTNPSSSPENLYILPGTQTPVCICKDPAVDGQILTALFRAVVKAGRILGKDDADTVAFAAVLARLPTPRISKRDGGIMEWDQDYEEDEPGHRHVSHLWGIYPGSTLLTPYPPRTSAASDTHDALPSIAALHSAARNTLDRRLAYGGGHTSWSMAWVLCLQARLRDATAADDGIRKLLAQQVLNSLLTTHPPFQIDGNLGYTAAVAEMLVQSHEEDENGQFIIDLLPALPPSWAEVGRVTGLRVRGAVDVTLLSWNRGRLEEVVLTSKMPKGTQVRTVQISQSKLVSGSGRQTLALPLGKPVRLSGEWQI